MMHTCHAVVQKILKSDARAVKIKAEALALKAMIAYVKRRRDLKGEFSFARALNIGLSVYTLRAGRYEYPCVSDEYKQLALCVRRAREGVHRRFPAPCRCSKARHQCPVRLAHQRPRAWVLPFGVSPTPTRLGPPFWS